MAADLTSYVPDILRDWWQHDPTEQHREVEGTLVFCDLSGFTALNERLSKHGKVGAELMSEIITDVFTALLDAARARGGDMLKFGGDALLLLFAGARHTERAAIAATEMRSILRTVGRIETPSGRVRLGMSMGAHTGTFDLFLVGEGHRELVVMGPGVTTTCAMETAADAGEILLSREAARALDERCVGAAKGPGFLLAKAPSAERSDRVARRDVRIDAHDLLASSLASYLATPSRAPEHRLVTVAFLHLTGADELLARRRTGEVTARLAETMSAAQEVLARHGVTFLATDVYHDGTKIMACTGAPTAGESDEDDMLLAMVELTSMRHPMGVRVGVNRGHAFAGDVGPPYRRTYTVLGDTTNTAARVMAKAKDGDVLATPAVLDGATTVFDTGDLPPFPAKGKALPLIARSVRRPIGTRDPSSSDDDTTFVGRTDLMASLRWIIEGVRRGGGGAVRLVSESGLGKSRTVRELERAAGDLHWVKVGCGPYVVDTPYFAIRELLRRLFGALATAEIARRLLRAAPELMEWLPLIAGMLDEPWPATVRVDEIDPAFRTQRLQSTLAAVLRVLLPDPVVLVVEDAHWIDEASAQALAVLAEAATDRPWLLLSTVRSGGSFGDPLVPGHEVVLDPLEPEAVAVLARELSHRYGVTSAVRDQLVERAAGNPFFLEELIATASAAPDGSPPPDSIEKVLVARIDRLPDDARAQLREAAVLGVRFHADALEALIRSGGGPIDWGQLGAFVLREGDGSCAFRQTLVRDVAYEGLSFRMRTSIHGRVVEIYEALGAPEDLLAIHSSRGGMHDRAWRYGSAAARAATAKYAHADSAGLYRLAIDAASSAGGVPAEQLAECWEALGDACEVLGRYDEASLAFHEARKRAPHRLPDLLRKEGELRERTARYSDALRWYRRGMRVAEQPDTKLGLALAYAGVRFRQGRYRDCIRWAEQALAEARAAGVASSEAHALHLLHLAHITLGDARRREFRGRAVPIYERLGNLTGLAKALNNLGVDAYWEGAWDEALEHWERSREVMRRVGDVVGVATLDNNIGEVLCDQGRFEEAELRFHDARTASRAVGYPMMVAMADKNLGRVAVRRGDVDSGRPLLEQAEQEFRQMKAEGLVTEAEALLAECDLIEGMTVEAVARVEAALAGLQPVPVIRAHLERLLGLALQQQGRLPEAGAALRASLEHAERADARYEVATTLEALAAWALAAGDAEADSLTARAAAAGRALAGSRAAADPSMVTAAS